MEPMFAIYFATILILLWVSWTDIKTRTISNEAVIALLLCVILLAWLDYGTVFLFPSVTTLIIGFILFLFKVIGAGDVKLMSVLMLTTPNEQVMSFLFLTTVVFGLLLIIFGWIFFRQSIKQQGLPYGVAISLGFLSNLWLFS
ncbi:prepilin peptidase CpaA [Bisgaardia hudsonensis]|uniref:Prepilin peptidase CpaA n=2 Tax=Bisgaardia hudsonensis TaxID=109472 RepID=A0A4R2MX77_9PAST|nr:prepilin peptidase CpaA [Bisgaardia hudsonensis]